MKVASEVVRIELEKKRAIDIPIAIFDRRTQTVLIRIDGVSA